MPIQYYSNSSTSTFRRCTYKFWKMYLAQGDKPEQEKSRGLSLGSAGHMALRAFYSGKTTEECLHWAYEEFSPSSEQEIKDFDRLSEVLKFYWSNVSPSDKWKVVEVELQVYWSRFDRVRKVLYEGDNRRRLVESEPVGGLQGIFDLIVKDTVTGSTFIVDHKFQQSRQISHLDFDTQVSFYLLLAKLLDIKVEGLLYNIIPMSYKDAPGYPIRRFVTRSESFLRNFRWELESQIDNIERFSASPVPIRNFHRDCVWDCQLRKLCLKGMEED